MGLVVWPAVRDASECGARWVCVAAAVVLAPESVVRRVVEVLLVGVESPLEVEPPLGVRLRVEELGPRGREMRERQGRGVSSRR